MFKGKIDIKMIFILVLAAGLILSWLFRPSKKIDYYEDEIKELQEQNQILNNRNDSLKLVNDTLDKEIKDIMESVDSIQVELDENKDKIKDLENGKGKVSGYVRNLNADGVAKSLSDYINRRRKSPYVH